MDRGAVPKQHRVLRATNLTRVSSVARCVEKGFGKCCPPCSPSLGGAGQITVGAGEPRVFFFSKQERKRVRCLHLSVMR